MADTAIRAAKMGLISLQERRLPMYCPHCQKANPAGSEQCGECGQPVGYLRDRLDLGEQFIFVRASEQQPVALKVDDEIRIYRGPAILSRYRHAVNFGDEPTQVSSPRARRLIQRL